MLGSQFISFTRRQGIPLYKIGSGRVYWSLLAWVASVWCCGNPDSVCTLITQAMARSSQSTPVRVTSPSNGPAPFSSAAPSSCTTSDLLAVLVRALCTCVRDGVGSQAVFSVACDGASSRMYCCARLGFLLLPLAAVQMQLLIMSLRGLSSSFLYPGHLLALSTALQWTPSIRALVLAPMLVTQLCCEDPVARLDAVGADVSRPMHIPRRSTWVWVWLS